MLTAILPPDPCLVAVALVIRSRDGPRFVFHYPPRPNTELRARQRLWGTELDESSSSDSEAGFSADDLESPTIRHFRRSGFRVDAKAGDDHYTTADGHHVVPWEHLFEFETRDLESILTPQRAFNKKKFMLTLEPLTYISYPVHIRKDGHWKKRRRRKVNNDAEPRDMSASILSDRTLMAESNEVKEVEPMPPPPPPADTDDDREEEDDSGEMTMFNVVFITNPRSAEKNARNLDIYEHIAKKINKALKYAQEQTSYVWRESEQILLMKERGKEDQTSMRRLWNQILDVSTLAQGLQEVYEAISRGKIANVHFASEPIVSLSVQIPVPFFISSLPENTERAMPGLWVTTATGMDADEEIENTVINKHFALLLLDDEDQLVSDIQAEGGELAAPLIEYIKISKPTMSYVINYPTHAHLDSFAQVAQANSISLADIRDLAQHLIYWRRALAIPPLHHRDVYVTSPNADNRKLPAASLAWAKAFPLAPPLPIFLSTISLGPRPYKTFAPSKVHRPTYMEMLAWLVRGGWVVNLRTYVRVVVWPEIIYEVHHALDTENLRRATDVRPGDGSSPGSASPTGSTDGSPKGKEKERERDGKGDISNLAEAARLARLTSKLSALRAEFVALPAPQISAHPSMSNPPHIQHIAPHIISDPKRADELESFYLVAIAQRLAGSTFAAYRAETAAAAAVATAAAAATAAAITMGSPASGNGMAAANGGPRAAAPTSSPLPAVAPNGGAATPASLASKEGGATGATATPISTNGGSATPQAGAPITPEAEKRVMAFRRLQKYCDGLTALEMVGTMEGIKRKELWNALSGFEEYLIAVRHW